VILKDERSLAEVRSWCWWFMGIGLLLWTFGIFPGVMRANASAVTDDSKQLNGSIAKLDDETNKLDAMVRKLSTQNQTPSITNGVEKPNEEIPRNRESATQRATGESSKEGAEQNPTTEGAEATYQAIIAVLAKNQQIIKDDEPWLDSLTEAPCDAQSVDSATGKLYEVAGQYDSLSSSFNSLFSSLGEAGLSEIARRHPDFGVQLTSTSTSADSFSKKLKTDGVNYKLRCTGSP
jgi:hypothetical protein